MTDTSTPVVPSAFTARRALRSAAVLSSGGLIVGMGVVTATPAFAATAADCTGSNTVDAATGDEADIRALLDADTAIVCLSGTFPIASTLYFNHDLTLFGLDDARLDGGNTSQLLTGGVGGSLTVQNIGFVNGSATIGGAIYVNGDLEVEDSYFTDNASFEDGGAIYVEPESSSTTVAISGSTFTNNSTGPVVDGFDGYSGGAIYVDGSATMGIESSTFTGNEASATGGAVSAYAAVMANSTFDDNTAQLGGAVFTVYSAAFESTFSDNAAEYGGATNSVIYGATFGSTFVDNEAGVVGGAMATGADLEGPVSYGTVLALNSTFVENTAGEVGGAIFTDAGQIGFTTFLENRANSSDTVEHSEAIFVTGIDDSLEIGGNIFAGSRSNAQLGADNEGAFDDRGGNVFSTSQSVEAALGTPDESTLFSRSVTAIFGENPQLDDNGGATDTVALIGTSPAINAVPDFDFAPTSAELDSAFGGLESASALTAAVDSTDVDQRNEPRDGLADAGAYEFGEPELAATGLDANASGLLGGLAALLLGAGALIVARSRRLVRTHPND